EQNRLLAELSEPGRSTSSQGHAFFVQMKELTIEGYYRSEAGMYEELGFAGNTFLSEFDGCTHEAHLSWRPRQREPEAERDN
ncbi:MAG: gluconate 2-dehydrogenase subunit 3 family protein, partial [Vicinamibacterales bacterium]|nr:gluconate 2-dehydrogenase subunit 3 family protein [Vicinamibacterales bacterium]